MEKNYYNDIFSRNLIENFKRNGCKLFYSITGHLPVAFSGVSQAFMR